MVRARTVIPRVPSNYESLGVCAIEEEYCHNAKENRGHK